MSGESVTGAGITLPWLGLVPRVAPLLIHCLNLVSSVVPVRRGERVEKERQATSDSEERSFFTPFHRSSLSSSLSSPPSHSRWSFLSATSDERVREPD